MCFVFVVMNVVFVARTTWFCGFPTSTIGSMKAYCFNVVHNTKV
jgi:hypothetical protein